MYLKTKNIKFRLQIHLYSIHLPDQLPGPIIYPCLLILLPCLAIRLLRRVSSPCPAIRSCLPVLLPPLAIHSCPQDHILCPVIHPCLLTLLPLPIIRSRHGASSPCPATPVLLLCPVIHPCLLARSPPLATRSRLLDHILCPVIHQRHNRQSSSFRHLLMDIHSNNRLVLLPRSAIHFYHPHRQSEHRCQIMPICNSSYQRIRWRQ